MKIGVIGLGTMGRLISAVAEQRGHAVVTVDPGQSDADERELSPAVLKGLDVCIEFSTPAAVLANIHAVLQSDGKLVVGTTGWYESLEAVEAAVLQNSRRGLLYASNFSVGVHIFSEMVRQAARIMNCFDAYDAAGVEYHHSRKADSPSGTAGTLADILLECIDRKEKLVFDALNRTIEPNELHFASVRCGQFPGTHEICFDSEADTITLRHTARNRNGFALGAVLAAEWLQSRSGFFSMQDLIRETLQGAALQG